MKYVLFVCTHNADRAQIAEAPFELYAREDGRVQSAGSDPVWHVGPAVIAVMREVGIHFSAHKPKRLSVETATRRLGGHNRLRDARADHGRRLGHPRPRGRPLDELREIRDMIDERAHELATANIDAIGSDTHRWRLAKLLPQLIQALSERGAPELIRGCANPVLDQYDDVPIRSHILSVAHKQTRQCLREQHCDLLESSNS